MSDLEFGSGLKPGRGGVDQQETGLGSTAGATVHAILRPDAWHAHGMYVRQIMVGEDGKKTIDLQDQALVIARKVGKRPLTGRILASRDFLKA